MCLKHYFKAYNAARSKIAKQASNLAYKKRKRKKQRMAEHQRAYRERQKAKAPQSTDNRSPERITSDAALEAAIMQRGWQLTQMMRTPLCMWPSDWLSND